MMERLQLGRSGPQASRLAYGSAALAGPWEAGELTPERRKQALGALEAALGAGINHFDLADVYAYGRAEQAFSAIWELDAAVRSRVIVQTKCGVVRAPGDESRSAGLLRLELRPHPGRGAGKLQTPGRGLPRSPGPASTRRAHATRRSGRGVRPAARRRRGTLLRCQQLLRRPDRAARAGAGSTAGGEPAPVEPGPSRPDRRHDRGERRAAGAPGAGIRDAAVLYERGHHRAGVGAARRGEAGPGYPRCARLPADGRAP